MEQHSGKDGGPDLQTNPGAAPLRNHAQTTVREQANSTKRVSATRYVAFAGVAVLILALDQITKLIVDRTFKNGSHIDLFGGLVRLDYTANTGAAFGMFRDQSALFALVAIVVGVGILIAFYRLRYSPWPVRFGLALILGGAAGNVMDRIRLGHVVDFIDLRWWPVFNVADSAVVVGVCLLVLVSVFGHNEHAASVA